MAILTYTIASSGGDYTSLSAAVSALATDLTSSGDTHIFELEDFSGGLNDNTAFSGYTSDTTDQIIIRAASGSEPLGQRETGAYFETNNDSVGVLRPVSGVRITINDIGFNLCQSPHNGNGGTIEDCFNLVISDAYGDGMAPSDIEGDWYNIVCINAEDDGLFVNASGATLTNATVVGSGNRGIYGGTLKNCVSVDSTNDDYAGSPTMTTCMSSDTTGSSGLQSATLYDDATKGSASSGDFIVQESALASFDGTLVDHVNNGALDAGTDSGAPDNDIAGNAFSNPPSLGAFELAGGDTPLSVTTTSPSLTITKFNTTVVTQEPESNSAEFLIYRNDSDNTSTVPNAGTNLDAAWDTSVASGGTDITYSAGEFTVGSTGKYLVMFSEQFTTTSTTNNERKEVQSRILVNGSQVDYGQGQGYIRQASGSQECAPYSAAILSLTANDTIETRFYRTDNSTTGAPNRVPDTGGVTILGLLDTWNYGRYRYNGNQSKPGTDNTWTTLSLDTNDEQDTGFSRSGNNITITNAGRYLVTYSMGVSITSGSARSDFAARIALDGNEVVGSRTYTYIRGTDSTQNGAVSWAGVVDAAASDVLTIEGWVEGDNTGNIEDLNIQIVELPSGNETFIAEATTGNYNTSATDFSWDTIPYIDTDAFTHTVGNTNVDVDVDDDYLVFASQWSDGDAATRAVPAIQFAVNDTIQTHGINSAYNRNSSPSTAGGITLGMILPDLAANDSIEVHNNRLGTNTTAMNNESGQFSGIRLGSIFPVSGGDVPLNVSSGSDSLSIIELNASVVTNIDLSVFSTQAPLTFTEYNTTVNTNLDLDVSAGFGTISLTPFNSSVITNVDLAITSSLNTLTITTPNPAVATNIDLTISAASNDFILTEFNPTITTAFTVLSGIINLNILSYDVNIYANSYNNSEVVSLSLTTHTPTVSTPLNVVTNSNVFTIVSYNPIVSLEQDLNLTTTLDELVITGYNTSVVTGNDLTVVSGVVDLTLTGYNTDIDTDIDLSIISTSEALNISVYDTTVVTTLDLNLSVNYETLVLTLYNTTVVTEVTYEYTSSPSFDSIVFTDGTPTVVLNRSYSSSPNKDTLEFNLGTPIVTIEYPVNYISSPNKNIMEINVPWRTENRPQVTIERAIKYTESYRMFKPTIPIMPRR